MAQPAWSFGCQMLDFEKSTTKKYVFKQAFQEYHSEFVYKLKSTQKICRNNSEDDESEFSSSDKEIEEKDSHPHKLCQKIGWKTQKNRFLYIKKTNPTNCQFFKNETKRK